MADTQTPRPPPTRTPLGVLPVNPAFTGDITIPEGTIEAYVVFDPPLVGVFRALWGGGGGTPESLTNPLRWSLFDGGESRFPLDSDLTMQFNSSVGGITATLHVRTSSD